MYLSVQSIMTNMTHAKQKNTIWISLHGVISNLQDDCLLNFNFKQRYMQIMENGCNKICIRMLFNMVPNGGGVWLTQLWGVSCPLHFTDSCISNKTNPLTEVGRKYTSHFIANRLKMFILHLIHCLKKKTQKYIN